MNEVDSGTELDSQGEEEEEVAAAESKDEEEKKDDWVDCRRKIIILTLKTCFHNTING